MSLGMAASCSGVPLPGVPLSYAFAYLPLQMQPRRMVMAAPIEKAAVGKRPSKECATSRREGPSGNARRGAASEAEARMKVPKRRRTRKRLPRKIPLPPPVDVEGREEEEEEDGAATTGWLKALAEVAERERFEE